jgi:WD40 repeat protein
MERATTAWSVRLPEAVMALDWLADGILVGASDGQVRRYDLHGGLLLAAAMHAAPVTRVLAQPAATARAASAGEDGRVVLWNIDTAEVTAELAAESAWIEHLAWAGDGHLLAAAAEKTIYLWRDGEPIGVWYDARRRVLAMAWAPDGSRLATAANKGLYLWRVGGREPVQLLEFPGAPVAVAWDAAGRALAVGTQDGFLQIWQQGADGPARQLTMRGYPGKVSCLAWHPGKALIASAGGPDVVLWPTEGPAAGRKARPLHAHQETVTALAYAPDGALLASGDRGGRLCLWDGAGEPVQVMQLGGEILSLAWSPDGTHLACGTTSGLLQLYATLPAGSG